MSAIAGINGDVWLSTSPSTALGSPESFTDQSDHIHYWYGTHQFWDPSQPLTVQNSPTVSSVNTQNTAAITVGSNVVTVVTGTLMTGIVVGSVLSIAAGGGTAESVTVTAVTGTTFTATFAFTHAANTAITTVWTTVTDYVFNWPVGEIVFNTARTVGVSNFTRVFVGNFFTVTALDGPHAWKMSLKGNVKDVTPFQAAGNWAVNLGTTKTMTFSVDCYRQDGRILTEMSATNISGGIILCQLWFNEVGGMRWQFYALPTGIAQNVDAMDVDKQSINFQSTGPIYFITSNTFSTTTVIQE